MNPAEFANIRNSEEQLWWYRGMRKIFFRMVQPYLRDRPMRRILEAGCGTGYFSKIMQQTHGWPVVPMDISADGLLHARRLGVDRPVQGDLVALPFRTASFDVVLSLDVIPHLVRGAEHHAAREFARVTAPGGLVVIRTAAFNVLRSRHSEYVHERQRFARRQLMGIMAASGIRVLRCTYANSILLPVAFAKFRLWEPLTRAPLASGVENLPGWLDSILYACLSVESTWLGAGRDLPLGQSLILIGEKMK